MSEIWKPVVGYENYEVSNLGRVKSLDRVIKYKTGRLQKIKGKLKTYKINNSGYAIVKLYKNDIETTFLLHRLVYFTFYPNADINLQVNHIDENKLNCNLENLNSFTPKENCNYGYRNKKMGDKHKKPIIQFDMDDRVIKLWDCAKNAAVELGIDNASISKCCKGKLKSSGGYIWKYLDDYPMDLGEKEKVVYF